MSRGAGFAEERSHVRSGDNVEDFRCHRVFYFVVTTLACDLNAALFVFIYACSDIKCQLKVRAMWQCGIKSFLCYVILRYIKHRNVLY